MDRGDWWATIQGVAELNTTEQLSLTYIKIFYGTPSSY